MVIWKYEVDVGANRLSMPEGAKILCIKQQGDGLFIWALVDKKAREVDRIVSVVGTGWDLSDKAGSFNYIGTVIKGSFVWHAFDGMVR